MNYMSVSNQPKFVSDDIFRARSTRCFCTMPSTCTSRCSRKSLSRDWTGTTAVSGTTSLATGPRTVSAFVIVLDTCGFHGAMRNRSSKRGGNSLCRNFALSWTVGSVAEWLACRRAWVQIASSTLSGNSLRQTVHTHRASVRQAAKLVAALLRVAG